MAAKNQPTDFRMSLGVALAAQFGRVRSRVETRRGYRRIEDIARDVGADLADPEQFRLCQELAAS